MTQENAVMLSQMTEGFDISTEEAIDNILTVYRAMRNANRIERIEDSYPEFMKVDGKLLTGERLYTMLLTMYRAELMPNPVPTKEMREYWEKEKDPDKSAKWED